MAHRTPGTLLALNACAVCAMRRYGKWLYTDVGVAALGGLKSARYLNLYGTRVTDRGLAGLAALPKLQRVHVWQTAVSPDGNARLMAEHPRVKMTGGAGQLMSAPVGGPNFTPPDA